MGVDDEIGPRGTFRIRWSFFLFLCSSWKPKFHLHTRHSRHALSGSHRLRHMHSRILIALSGWSLKFLTDLTNNHLHAFLAGGRRVAAAHFTKHLSLPDVPATVVLLLWCGLPSTLCGVFCFFSPELTSPWSVRLPGLFYRRHLNMHFHIHISPGAGSAIEVGKHTISRLFWSSPSVLPESYF